MSQEKHPEFPEEEYVLEQFMEDLRRDSELIVAADLGGVNSAANLAIMKHLMVIDESRGEAIHSYPYFGRVDYERDGEVKRLYIGRSFFEGSNFVIVSHNSNVADLFYDGEEHATVGGEPVRLLLSRQLTIKQARLREMFDRVDRRAGGSGIVASSAIQDHLLRQLAITGAKGLRDIAESMVSEQRAIIRAPVGASLIINGVAGSGKTSIAYHRLSYLLSRDIDPSLRLEPQRTLFVGPSAYFTKYASTLLPSLELNQIRHTSFDDLALSAMPRSGKASGVKKNRYRVRDGAVVRKSGAVAQSAAKRRDLKSGRRFAAVMERLSRRDVGLKRLEKPLALSVKGSAHGVELTQVDFDECFGEAIRTRGRPATQRGRMVDDLLRRGIDRFAAQESGVLDTAVERAWRKRLSTAVARMWPPVTARDIYYEWLQDRDAVHAVCRGRNEEQLQALLVESPKAPKGAINREDLAAVFYLHLLRTGKSAAVYDHVVVDEGQDFSVMQLSAIKLLSRTRVFTVLGDVAQRIHHSGGKGWNDVSTTLDVLPNSILIITQSYRSTEEIVEFSNSVLSAVANDVVSARPVPRHGDRPRVFAASSQDAMTAAIAEELRHLRGAFGNVAVLTRSLSAAGALAKELGSRGIAVAQPSDRELSGSTSVTVLPAELAKGVEYDAVVVADASAASYTRSKRTDGHLLYVAVTRAMHYLSLHFVGQASPYLEPFYRDYLAPRDANT